MTATLSGADTVAIRFLVDRMHVRTPESEVVADIERRLKGRKVTVEYRQAIIDFALEVHRENLDTVLRFRL